MSTTHEQDHKHEPKGHTTTIIINGRSTTVTQKELTFEEVVALSGLPAGPDVSFSIIYRRGHGDKPSGSMVQGGVPVKVKEGMVFNVSSTTRS
jgi:hypothetical protein